MPLLTQRLNSTLEKLQTPKEADIEEKIATGSLLHWWQQLQQHYTVQQISFNCDIKQDIEIPIDCFTTTIENLLDNAIRKRILESDIDISVNLHNSQQGLCLDVSDTGSAIEKQVTDYLFSDVISSRNGFGIGLYQSYTLAKNHGYELSLSENSDSRVCFTLQQITLR